MVVKLLSLLRQQTLGALALFVALGGTSYAVATGSIDSREIKNNTIRSKDIRNGQVTTRDIRNNSVRSGDVRNKSLLRKDFKPGQLPRGPEGLRGIQGPQGAPGAPAAKYFATVAANGVLSSGTATASGQPWSGFYNVEFPGDVSKCAASVTPRSLYKVGAQPGRRWVVSQIAYLTEDANSVAVRLEENGAFSIAVFC